MELTEKKILIIDDDIRNIFALKAVLKAKKYTCESAISAQEGFKLLDVDPQIKLILMDMMMPEMDGYEAISYLKSHTKYKSIPIIAVTAQAMMGDKERSLAVGASAYVSKPIKIDELLKHINVYF
ncbi:MAG: response regulator [Pedobacter sp.]|nr:MAG: response regulator [Pedobacter sp.]